MKPKIARVGSAWRAVWDEGVEITFAEVRRERRAWWGLVTGRLNGELIGRSQCDLMSGRNRDELLKEWRGYIARSGWAVDVWDDQFKAVFDAVYDAASRPSAPVVLNEVVRRPLEFLVTFGRGRVPVIPFGEVSVFQGDGGSTKSYQALAIAMACAYGETVGPWEPSAQVGVLYLDWETREEVVRDRAERLREGVGLMGDLPEWLYYMRGSGPLVEIGDELRELVDERKVQLVVVDSLAAALGTDVTQEFVMPAMAVLRGLGKDVAVLVISHISAAAAMDTTPGPRRAYGTVQVRNQARATYEIRGVSENEDARTRIVSVTREKINDDIHNSKPMVVRMKWDGREGPVQMQELRGDDVPEVVRMMRLPDRVLLALRRGSRDAKALAEESESTEMSVRKVLQQLVAEGRVVVVYAGGGRGNQTLYGLPSTNREYLG